jgi:hypothetical protein
MTKKEIKEQASDKIYAKYLGSLREKNMGDDAFWSIDKDRARELKKCLDKDVEIYSYILSLIEKDNK